MRGRLRWIRRAVSTQGPFTNYYLRADVPGAEVTINGVVPGRLKWMKGPLGVGRYLVTVYPRPGKYSWSATIQTDATDGPWARQESFDTEEKAKRWVRRNLVDMGLVR